MIKILFLFVLLTSSTIHAEPWTTEERAWGAVAGTLLMADWATTRYGSRHWHQGYHETNRIYFVNKIKVYIYERFYLFK